MINKSIAIIVLVTSCWTYNQTQLPLLDSISMPSMEGLAWFIQTYTSENSFGNPWQPANKTGQQNWFNTTKLKLESEIANLQQQTSNLEQYLSDTGRTANANELGSFRDRLIQIAHLRAIIKRLETWYNNLSNEPKTAITDLIIAKKAELEQKINNPQIDPKEQYWINSRLQALNQFLEQTKQRNL